VADDEEAKVRLPHPLQFLLHLGQKGYILSPRAGPQPQNQFVVRGIAFAFRGMKKFGVHAARHQ